MMEALSLGVAAYLSLFVWSFLAASLIPLASEPALLALVLRTGATLLPVAVASLGNYLGAVTTYLLAGALARRVAERWRKPVGVRATELMRRYGPPALLLSWVPAVGDGIVAAAGVARVPFWPFSLWVLLGKVSRYAAVAWFATRVQ